MNNLFDGFSFFFPSPPLFLQDSYKIFLQSHLQVLKNIMNSFPPNNWVTEK